VKPKEMQLKEQLKLSWRYGVVAGSLSIGERMCNKICSNSESMVTCYYCNCKNCNSDPRKIMRSKYDLKIIAGTCIVKS
jgi:hypothetical protein